MEPSTSVLALLEWPLRPLEIVLLLAGMALLIILLEIASRVRTWRKARRFPQSYPDAALVLLYLDGQPADRGNLRGEKGVLSALFPIRGGQHPAGTDGLAFYVSPGPTTATLTARRQKRENNALIATGRIAFRAEPGAIYRAELHSGAPSELILLNGRETDFLLQEERVAEPEGPFTLQRPLSPDICSDLHLRELRRLLLSCGLLLLPLGYLVLAAGLPIYLLLLSPGLFLIALCLHFTVWSRDLQRVFSALPELRQEHIQMAFQRPHPVCKLFLGEVQLLPDCLICHQGGRLSLIPLERVVRAEVTRPGKTYGLTNVLILQMDTGRKYQLEFSGRHKKELPAVLAWVRSRNPCILVG